MAIINITTIDTIKRLKESCIEDLMELYDNKSQTRKKENLFTLYLKANVGLNKVDLFLEKKYSLQKEHFKKESFIILIEKAYLERGLVKKQSKKSALKKI